MAISRDDLFTLLDGNFHKYFPKGKTFWRELHSLDGELTPGCISYALVSQQPATDLRTGDDSSRAFTNQKVLTIGMQTAEAAKHGATLLNHIFEGCGTEFIAESYDRGEQAAYRIRGNIDKSHWDKLCVFCSYRFEREIPKGEQKLLLATCQKTIDQYTYGTDSDGWRAVEGVPAICTLMGLHGNLRPAERYGADPARKTAEINHNHPRGNPLAFDGVVVHVDVKKGGEVKTMPYKVGFDPGRVAMGDATGNEPYLGLLLETFGGNPFAKHLPLSRRAIFSVGLALGTIGAVTGGEMMLGWLGPAAAATGAGVFVIATYVDHRLKIIDRIDGIRRGSKEARELEAAVAHVTQQSTVSMSPEPPVAPEIHRAYTRDEGHAHAETEGEVGACVSQAIRALVDGGPAALTENRADAALRAGVKQL